MRKSGLFTVAASLLLAIIPGSPAIAGNLSSIVNGKSYHVDSTYDWNEDNYGIGFEYEFDSESAWRKTIMASGFLDSTDNMSYVAGGGLHRRLFQTDRLNGLHIYLGLNAFLMTRSDVGDNKLFPGILPSLNIGNKSIGVNLTYLPKKAVEMTTNSQLVDPTISGIFFLQLKVSIASLLPR